MTTSPATTTPITGTWRIDSVHSSAAFKVVHNRVATFRGSLHDIHGVLENDMLSGEVDVNSINIGPLDVFRQQLLSEEWFDAANHPKLLFRSTILNTAADGAIDGAAELTLRGLTRTVSLSGQAVGPAEIVAFDGSSTSRLGITLATTVDRRGFGLTVSSGTAWEVALEVTLELISTETAD
jgi:polyisoprenoid-binding protein YceI